MNNRELTLACPSIRTVIVTVPIVDYPVDGGEDYGPGRPIRRDVIAYRSEIDDDGDARTWTLVADGPGELARAEELLDGELWARVVCPWDPKEDEERLAAIVASLSDQARKLVDGTVGTEGWATAPAR